MDLTYGTVISLSNLCIRNLTKGVDHQRSPSPAKSPQPAAASTATSSFGLLTTTAGGSNSGVQEANNSASANLSPTSISSMDKRRLVLVRHRHPVLIFLHTTVLHLFFSASKFVTAKFYTKSKFIHHYYLKQNLNISNCTHYGF